MLHLHHTIRTCTHTFAYLAAHSPFDPLRHCPANVRARGAGFVACPQLTLAGMGAGTAATSAAVTVVLEHAVALLCELVWRNWYLTRMERLAEHQHAQ